MNYILVLFHVVATVKECKSLLDEFRAKKVFYGNCKVINEINTEIIQKK